MAKCLVCGVVLSIDNTYASNRDKSYNICKKCFSKKVSDTQKRRCLKDPLYKQQKQKKWNAWRRNNRQRFNDYCREYLRKNVLVVNGVYHNVKKRERPEICEMCGERGRRLTYHHWDDNDLRKAVWICSGLCHLIAEVVDCFQGFALQGDVLAHPKMRNLVNKYLELKTNIEAKLLTV